MGSFRRLFSVFKWPRFKLRRPVSDGEGKGALSMTVRFMVSDFECLRFMAARPPTFSFAETSFSLLRQRKVGKRKATAVAGSSFGANFPHYAELWQQARTRCLWAAQTPSLLFCQNPASFGCASGLSWFL